MQNNIDKTEMNWFKKPVDTVVILTALLGSVLWMNSRFNVLDHRLTVIETVLVMKNIMPSELVNSKE